MHQVTEHKRQRAPSKRSLETRTRIFDAAELIFAARGFEGASIRDIAEAAQVQKALVSFHGDSKERLIAQVSADPRWRDIADTCFDPVAKRFIAVIARQHPQAEPQAVASCFVFTVSAMLSLCTSQWRVSALG